MRTFLQGLQLLAQPVHVLLQVVQAVDQAAVGAQPQLRLRKAGNTRFNPHKDRQ